VPIASAPVIDPRAAVLVGVGQAIQRPHEPTRAREPIDLLADAARAADADAGTARSVLARIDTIAVVDIVSWQYPDPGALRGRRPSRPRGCRPPSGAPLLRSS